MTQTSTHSPVAPAGGSKDVVRRFYAAYTNGTPEVFAAILTEDYTDHGHQPPGIGAGGARADYEGLTSIFSDVSYDLESVVAEGDQVAVRWTGHLTHTGTFGFGPGPAIPPTGRRITVSGASFYRVVGDRIAEVQVVQSAGDVRALLQDH